MNQHFHLLHAFTDDNVRFLIVGAYALAVHGRPRATGDLDVWIDATPENAANVMPALEQFGAPPPSERGRFQPARQRVPDGAPPDAH